VTAPWPGAPRVQVSVEDRSARGLQPTRISCGRSRAPARRPRPGQPSRQPCGRCPPRCVAACCAHEPGGPGAGDARGRRGPAAGVTRSSPGGEGGGLVSSCARAGSTVTIIGTANAPVPATTAFRRKSRRATGSAASPASCPPLVPVESAMTGASGRPTTRGDPTGPQPYPRPTVPTHPKRGEPARSRTPETSRFPSAAT
jgi:hypothetical protein